MADEKPPLGVLNRDSYESGKLSMVQQAGGVCLQALEKMDADRLESVKGAIQRYTEEGLQVPYEWHEGYNELIWKLS